MKVMVLGGSGYIGTRLVAMLREAGHQVVAASSRAQPGEGRLRLDTRDGPALALALNGCDAVVNAVAGDAGSIATGARLLAAAAGAAGVPRLVHLSTMSVYGAVEGRVDEATGPGPVLGWYDRAKREAEQHLVTYLAGGGMAVVLRPGCVWGPDCELWVGRIGRWLRAGRLGDLGAAGDGWSNLVHVNDVCVAAMRSLEVPLARGECRAFNLAAPDSPRWNEYFTDLALEIGATPVRRLSPRQLTLDAKVAGPVLHVMRKLLRKAGRGAGSLPDPVTPGLLGVWQRHLHLDSRAASESLHMDWTPYPVALQEAAAWFLQAEGPAPARSRPLPAAS
ncbi:NAD-dependent epimerase/dehydratase family protein [Ramlibacter humi]|uniref:NAD(P)-dependent oxidoreductase n=1 Tax=Ramlibacter humi TaxID=2530451 RepID=A0A4Z0BP35_9BURK|nr:NAD(P)-dependent oxidoreductase [Ramlibacter humi]TFZ00180.1 NAD(P)-dependent oxidoreductase [Ramlibacter humi]